MKPTIGALLAAAQTQVVGSRQDLGAVQARSALTRLLADHYPAFHVLRLHLFHGHPLQGVSAADLKRVTDALCPRGWIAQAGPRAWQLRQLTADDELYLRGGWLEELLWLAHEAAGCDELLLGAQLEWDHEGTVGYNEIDVIARRGETLSFTSCKCVRPLAANTHEQIRGHVLEAGYWNLHFADGQGRAILAVTADVYDEQSERNRRRYPLVHARAAILDVDLLGLEELSWKTLVHQLRDHWA